MWAAASDYEALEGKRNAKQVRHTFLRPLCSPTVCCLCLLFFRFVQHNDTGWGAEGGQNQKLSPLPRGGLAAAQGEEVGSNERSWPSTERPGSARLAG